MSDEILTEVVDLLYGPGSELISKMEPTQSDLATKDRKKRAVTSGLAAVGATAGAGGLALAGKEMHHGYKTAPKALKVGGKLKHVASNKKLAVGLLPLEAAGLGGEVMATKILHADSKKPVKKRAGTLRLLDQVEKNAEVDVIWNAEIAKADADKQQIFGWASVVEVNGEPIVDLQGDRISPDEMEKAGYEYVMKSRKGGDMHLRDDWSPVQKSEMIESFIVTEEKRDAMGLPDSVPTGWWVGFQVQDPEVWAKVKSGERTGFSIHGHGRRS